MFFIKRFKLRALDNSKFQIKWLPILNEWFICLRITTFFMCLCSWHFVSWHNFPGKNWSHVHTSKGNVWILKIRCRLQTLAETSNWFAETNGIKPVVSLNVVSPRRVSTGNTFSVAGTWLQGTEQKTRVCSVKKCTITVYSETQINHTGLPTLNFDYNINGVSGKGFPPLAVTKSGLSEIEAFVLLLQIDPSIESFSFKNKPSSPISRHTHTHAYIWKHSYTYMKRFLLEQNVYFTRTFSYKVTNKQIL